MVRQKKKNIYIYIYTANNIRHGKHTIRNEINKAWGKKLNNVLFRV